MEYEGPHAISQLKHLSPVLVRSWDSDFNLDIVFRIEIGILRSKRRLDEKLLAGGLARKAWADASTFLVPGAGRVIPVGFEAFAFQAEPGSFILFEQVEGDAVDEGKSCAEWPARFLLASSPKATSSDQCSLFSMPQCWRTAEFSRAASGRRLLM